MKQHDNNIPNDMVTLQQQDLKNVKERLAILEQNIDKDHELLVQKLTQVLRGGEEEDIDIDIENTTAATNSPRKEIENIVHAKVDIVLKQVLDHVISQKIQDFMKEKYSESTPHCHPPPPQVNPDEKIKEDDDDISFDESIQDKQHNQEQQDHADVENQAPLITNKDTSSNNPLTTSALSIPTRNEVNVASPLQTELYRDSYSLMILSLPFKTRSWWFAAAVFALQFLLLCLFIYGQLFENSTYSAIFIPPINNTLPVAMAQFLAIIVTLLMTTDLIEATKSINILSMGSFADSNCQSVLSSSVGYSSPEEIQLIIDTRGEKTSQKLYRKMVLLPNILKFVQGLLALVTSFIIIIQSSDVIDLFKDFLALQIVSSIDDISYWLCLQGFFGKHLQEQSNKVRNVVLKDGIELDRSTRNLSSSQNKKMQLSLPFHSLIVLIVFFCMVTGWGIVVNGQVRGIFYEMKYPQCQVKQQGFNITNIGDGKCDGGLYNRYECAFDGGDCVDFQLAYPDCNQNDVKPWKIADGDCDNENNRAECGFDGGDCCGKDLATDEKFSNGVCDATPEYNNEQCKFDNGECAEHNKKYGPKCFVEDLAKLGDGYCNGGNYFSSECKNDGGDCTACIALGVDPSLVGNGECDYGIYLSSECGYDGGDCNEYAACVDRVADPSLISNGICDGGLYLYPHCNNDGGDCLWKQLGDDIDGESAFDYSGYSVSMSSDGTRVAIGAPGNDGGGTYAGHVRIFNYADGSWVQVGGDINGESADDYSGYSVSMSSDGTRVAIGARLNDGGGTDAGHVRIYDYIDGSWLQVGGDIDGESDGDYSGSSVSMSSDGTRVAIGARFHDGGGDGAGHVRIYDYVDGLWVQVGGDINSESADDYSGYSLSMSSDGTRVAISAIYLDGGEDVAGHVRIFDYADGSWVQVGGDIDDESATNLCASDLSGPSVSMSSDGTRVATGASTSNDGGGTCAGHVRIYDYVDGSWVQVGGDIDGESVDDISGSSVSMSSDGTRVAIGATGNDGRGDRAGHVRIYEYVDGSWVHVGDDIDGESCYDYSGSSVSMSSDGTRVAIGAYRNDGGGDGAGHVRIYSLD